MSESGATHIPRIKFQYYRDGDGEIKKRLDTRVRCVKHNKVVFDSEKSAQRSSDRATDRGTPMRPYLGDCGHWHVARRTRRNP